MAVAYDNSETGSAAATNIAATNSFTISGSNVVGVVTLKFEISKAVTALSVSLSGAACSAVTGAAIDAQSSVDIGVKTYYVIAPPTGASKTGNASWTTASYCRITAATFTGADQTTGVNNGNAQNGASSANVPITITSTSGDMAIAFATASGAVSGGDQTLLWNDTQTRTERNTGGGTTTFNFTTGSGYGCSAGCNVIQLAAGRTTKNSRAFPLGMEIGMNWRS